VAAHLGRERRAQQRRFSSARVADQDRDRLRGRQSVLEIAQRFAVLAVKNRNFGFDVSSNAGSRKP